MPDVGRETGKITRRATLRAAAGTVGIGGAALAGALIGTEVSPAGAAGTPTAASAPGQEIVGTWLNKGGNGRGPKIATFTADGGWSNVHPDHNRTAAEGTWKRVGDRTFHITRWSIRFDAQGRVSHLVKTRAESVVDPDGQGLTSRRITEYLNLTDKLVFTSPTIESRSTRITTEPFP